MDTFRFIEFLFTNNKFAQLLISSVNELLSCVLQIAFFGLRLNNSLKKVLDNLRLKRFCVQTSISKVENVIWYFLSQ